METCVETAGLRSGIGRVLHSYGSAKRETFGGHPLERFIRKDLPVIVIEDLGTAASGLIVKGSAGQGQWADSPWIALMDPAVTNSPQRGFYVAYLFAGSMQRVVLSLNQGIGAFTTMSSSEEALDGLRRNTELIRSAVPEYEKRFDDGPISLDARGHRPAWYYQAGHAFGRSYERTLPPEVVMIEDLRSIVQVYRLLIHRNATLQKRLVVPTTASGKRHLEHV